MTILEIFILLMCAIGITAIFDSRTIVEKFFSSNDKITTIKVVKLSGAMLTLTGILILYFIK